MVEGSRQVVVVSGAPGSGKTTIAVPLAQMLGFQLLTKDAIKESIDDSARPSQRDLAWSKLTGGIAYDVMWSLASHFSRVVLESNFYPTQSQQILNLSPAPVEVYCSCPPDLARSRYRERAKSRHPVHVELDLPVERFADWSHPLGLGTVIIVDTTREVDVDALSTQVRHALQATSRLR